MNVMIEREIVTTDNFRQTMEMVPDKIKSSMMQFVDDHIVKYKDFVSKKLPEEVAMAVHIGIDEALKEQSEMHPDVMEKVSCKKGCSYCCYMRVDTTIEEGHLLLSAAAEKGIELDWDLLQKQAEKDDKNGNDKWYELPYEERACQFLDKEEGICTVYEHRPASCRKYFVNSPPEDCKDDGDHDAILTRYNCITAEMLTVSAWNGTEKMGNLANMLLTAREARKEETRIICASCNEPIKIEDVGAIQDGKYYHNKPTCLEPLGDMSNFQDCP